MTREARRGIRVVGGVLNIVIQILMLWIIIRSLEGRNPQSVEQLLILIKSMLTHVSIMMGTFFIYFALVNLVTKRNVSSHRSSE